MYSAEGVDASLGNNAERKSGQFPFDQNQFQSPSTLWESVKVYDELTLLLERTLKNWIISL